jgi:DNA-binding response OmpR family regulator
VVEDDLVTQRMLREFLESVGYRVSVSANGREALEALRASRPCLVVADIVMPVMDGRELCERVRADPATADIPFLFLTAVPQRLLGLRRGADDLITKPFSRQELLARVERILARQERLRALEAGGASPLTGHTSQVPLADLLQLLSLNARSGVVRLEGKSGRRARVHLREGRIVHATAGGVEGRKALFRVLEWDDARFEMDPLGEPPPDETIPDDPAGLLMEAMARNDELRAELAALPPLGTRLRARAGRQAEGVQRLEEAERAVLARFESGASLEEVLDRCPESDLEIGRILRRLHEMGLLVPEA